VFAFEHMGVKTGVDLGKLLPAADHVAAVEPCQAGGKLRTVPRKRALAGFGDATRGLPA
jgi:hydroxymethylglutaryl-CoA lyase